MDKIGIIIGSLTAITEKQVEYLKRTVHSGTLNIKNCPEIKLFYLQIIFNQHTRIYRH